MFVSSTSAIDTDHYVQLSESLARLQSNFKGVPESDDLEGARSSLKTGYGQSKWVSEKLLFEAGKRGLRGHIVRPGYVVGDSRTAGEYSCSILGFKLLVLKDISKLQTPTILSGGWSRDASNLDSSPISTTPSTWFLSIMSPAAPHWQRWRLSQMLLYLSFISQPVHCPRSTTCFLR